MSRDILTVGSTIRIPLLYRGEYSQWVERFMNYLEEQTDGEAMINSIKNGDQPLPRVTQVSIAGTTSTEQPLLKDKSMWSDQEKRVQKIDHLARSLLIQRLPNDIFSLIDSNKTAKDLWDALARHMLGSEYGEQDRKAAVLYEYETFKATEGELLLDTYIRYLQVINDLKKYGYSKDNCELNFKFLNNLQPEWKQYATMTRHNKNLMDINIDAIYNILKQNQGDVNDAMGSKKKTVVITSDPLALIAEKTNVSRSKEKVVVSSDSEGSEADDFKQAFWSQYSMQTDEPNLFATTTIVEVPKELPKVSMVNSCLKKLKYHLASFDMVVKERTTATATAITKGTWGFEHTKVCFRDDIIPFVKALKELFTSFDQYLIDEVTKVQNFFKQMELAKNTLSSSESAPTFAEFFEIIELKAQAQAKDTVILQLKEKLHSLKALNEQLNKLKGKVVLTDAVSLNLIDPKLLKVDVAPLVPKLRKNMTAHTDYIWHTQDEAATLREIVESERLLSPLNTSLGYACCPNRPLETKRSEAQAVRKIAGSKGKSVDTKFDRPSVVRQPNAQRIPKPSVLVKKTVSNTNVLKTEMYRIDNRTSHTRAPQLPQTVRNNNPRLSTSTGVNHKPTFSRPQLKSNQLKDKVLPSNSQVKAKKTQVEVHPRIPSVSNKMKSVTATKKPTVVPISTRKPKSQTNKSVVTPHKKKVASKSTNQKPRSYFRVLYENTNKAWKWWIERTSPLGYKWVPKQKKQWIPKAKMQWVPKAKNDQVQKRVSFAVDNASRITNVLKRTNSLGSNVSTVPSSSNSLTDCTTHPIYC
uniref:Integrase, catalytic region, zinc finger, CCHC-type, peptidase aspartic, catalytic n=1 Tax=Tanacetum cinerariifolium TaxID=118510 RepID=A0A6L2NA83_TANCI|nr:hypothetical protein [Tanacetum cinerariifolium]